MTLHSTMGTDLVSRFGGLLRCMTCGKERKLSGGDAGRFLASGWPKCCGYTMRWLTQRELDQAATLDSAVKNPISEETNKP